MGRPSQSVDWPWSGIGDHWCGRGCTAAAHAVRSVEVSRGGVGWDLELATKFSQLNRKQGKRLELNE